MTSSDFKPEELVDLHGKLYPVVGSRLRLAHQEGLLSIKTEIVVRDEREAIVKATVTMPPALAPTGKDATWTHSGRTLEPRVFNAHGSADVVRDAKRKDHLLGLAETRAIARALRMAGYGVEFSSLEEMPTGRPRQEQEEDEPVAPTRPAPTVAPVQLSPRDQALLRRQQA